MILKMNQTMILKKNICSECKKESTDLFMGLCGDCADKVFERIDKNMKICKSRDIS